MKFCLVCRLTVQIYGVNKLKEIFGMFLGPVYAYCKPYAALGSLKSPNYA